MTSPKRIRDLYAAAGVLGSENGSVELTVVPDPRSGPFDIAVRELGRRIEQTSPPMLAELLAMARQLRWHLAVEPYPASYSARRVELVGQLTDLAHRCKTIVGNETSGILGGLINRAIAAGHGGVPPTGRCLLELLSEAGYARCAVVLANPRVADAVRLWFRDLKIDIPAGTWREQMTSPVLDHLYLVGSPSVFGSPILTAPRAYALNYLFPSWVKDRDLPTTAFSDVAEGGIKPHARIHALGDDPVIPQQLLHVENRLVPQPIWRSATAVRQLGADEVLARRILLAGGFAIMLDDEGELIRTLDPNQPAGERVELRDVKSLAPGACLVLREGGTESEALYSRAIALLGQQAENVEKTQIEWKTALHRQLLIRGRAEVIRSLSNRGVRAAAQAPAWAAPRVARPQRSIDFDILLRWLQLESEPYREHADLLRHARSQAAADVRESLERALAESDISRLEHDGYLRINLELEGIVSIVATRILAISPRSEPVSRHDVRRLKEDRAARWLE